MIQTQTSNGKPAYSQGTVSKPHDWDKAVSVAHLRLLGVTQKVAAENAGVSERTVQEWEKSGFWPTAQAEARGRWLQGVQTKAMCGLETGVLKDGRLALDLLERLMPELAPAIQRHEVSSILSVLAQMPMTDLQRLEGLDDEEFSSEVNRLAGSTS